MIKAFYRFLLNLFGWKVFFYVPSEVKKYIIAVAPHTSNFDFIIGVLVRGSLGLKASFLGKDSLFKFPWGIIFRKTGGIPVDRSKSSNMVDQIAKLITENDEFILAIAPEGTRKKVEKWRSGFYFIALKAKIPIIFATMDWRNHEVRFLDPFYPTGNFEEDLIMIKNFFKGIKGYRTLN